MNVFYKDSLIFIKKASGCSTSIPLVEDDIFYFLNFALGLERILKGILYDINPLYILQNQSFKETASIFYKDKFIKKIKTNNDINIKASGKVISFRDSLSKVRHFSETAFKHYSILLFISNYRDIIAHADLSKIDFTKLREILNRDFIIILNSFAKELKIPEFVESFDRKTFASVDERYESEYENEIKQRLKKHKNIWSRRKSNQDKIREIEYKTFSLVDTKIAHNIFDSITCPACGNIGIVTLEEEPAYLAEVENERIYSATHFHCYYCDLDIHEYHDMDFLEINQTLMSELVESEMFDDYYE